MTTGGKYSERRLKGWARFEEALKLRAAGATWKQLAERLGYHDAPTAYRSFKTYFDRQISERTDEMRAVINARLDIALNATLPKVAQGQLAAVDRLLRIEDQRARLYGLYQESLKVEGGITVNNGGMTSGDILTLIALSRAARQLPGGIVDAQAALVAGVARERAGAEAVAIADDADNR